MDGKYSQACDEQGAPVHPERSVKPSVAHILMNVRPDGRRSVSSATSIQPRG